MPASVSCHVSRVRALYRKILQLHQGLPLELKALGDQYVKEEFRRHKSVGQEEAQCFLQEWETFGFAFGLQHVANWILGARLSSRGVSYVQQMFAGIPGHFVEQRTISHPGLHVPSNLEASSAMQKYAVMLWQQANQNTPNSTSKPQFGAHLPEEKLNALRNEQMGQLLELMQEATKPKRQFDILDDPKSKS